MATASQYSQIAEAQLSEPLWLSEDQKVSAEQKETLSEQSLEGSTAVKAADSGRLADGNSPGLSSITVDKSVEFTYEELATATNDFSIANKIGHGGFGAVYYAELRGEVLVQINE
ncbi:hypothetical protein RND71_018454 [Anisodus tanguticus]|uniref:Uncharacterized protein n=1 Tax=Anisodus tanguticus TaxID=243964 RepID=A0AAE1S5Q6_9SOLA|nr:hypothetical protein RND71_018454 [Anisodus tanguticus]